MKVPVFRDQVGATADLRISTGVGARAVCRRIREHCLVTAIGGAALLSLAGPVFGQGAQPPIDINEVQPTAPPPASEPTEPAAAAAEPVPGVPVPDDGGRYPISRFVLEYRTEHPSHPSVDELLGARVRLGVTADGYVAYREGLPSVDLKLGDVVDGSGGVFYRSAIQAVVQALVVEINKRGYIGIFVQLHPEDIDEATGTDLRGGKSSDLRMIIWTGVVKQLRTIASGERLEDEIEADPAGRMNSDDPVQRRIRTQSPLQAEDLLRKDYLDDYVFRLNRHPGRRVDVAISPGESSEEVVVDYLVSETKPWSVYAQVSNTGTASTGEWRERFGFVHNQLTGHDDILRIDYITSNFDASHAVMAGYEFPLISDQLRARGYGMWSTFTASDVGFADETFDGTTYGVGGELVWNVYQHREFFVDAIGGWRLENVEVNSPSGDGKDNFFLPYFGLRLDRNTEAASTLAGVTMEFQLPGVAGTDIDEIQNLGRLGVDDEWQVIKFDAEQTFYLEPLLWPGEFAGEGGGEKGTLANEVAISARGQYAFDYRLVPTAEEVAGGMFTVRGYPESITAGDTVYIGSLEYRFHVPRILPISKPGMIGQREMGWLGNNFRWAPQQPYGRADWDYILKAFVDAAQTQISDPRPGEFDHTLIGAGVGAELQFKRNLSVRLDLGFALEAIDDEPDTVDSGDARLHFSMTLLY